MDELNISICSYNTLWEIMDWKNSSITKKLDINYVKTAKKNIISNITTVKDYLNPDFFCFQESSDYQSVLNIFSNSKLNNYNYNVNKSGEEYMLTIWKSRFILVKKLESDFENGRPFVILILFDDKTKKTFCLINLHAGHKSNTFSSIFEPIQKIINNKIKYFNDVTRITMVGDFNRDICKEIELDDSEQFIIKIGKKKFKFNYSKDQTNTCCSLSGNKNYRNYDHVIDSESKPKKFVLIDQPWYKNPSSDHAMILGVIDK